LTLLFARRARITAGSLLVESEGEHGLRISFEVNKSVEASENSARIQIYNLSDTTRARLSDEADRFDEKGIIRRIVLEAGYVEDVRQIFVGDKAWIGHARQGTDWITTIDSLDGVKALSKPLSKSFKPNITATSIINEIKDQAGLVWDQLKGGDVQQALDTLVYGSGKALSGSVRKELDAIADDAGLEYSVQDGELLFHVPDGDSPNTGLRLTGESGLLGLPETFLDPARKTSPTKKSGKATDSPFGKNKTLVRGKALLNGRIQPGRRMELDLQNSRWGLFRAIRVQHAGDTHGGDESWVTTFEAEEVTT
jgi:hypothetical protein